MSEPRRLHWDADAHGYQRQGVDHLVARDAAMLWLAPGYGKSSIALHAFKRLLDAGKAQHMLVVAPLRVVQTVWAQEIETWASLHGLTACRLHGPKKEEWLKRRDANVWLINYEGLPWLRTMAQGGRVKTPFDVVVFDEVRRLKNSQSLRFRSARPVAKAAKWRWGLTGTPAANGLMDLFGQFLILDDGAALGTRLTHFRHNYFEKGYDGFSWLPRPGAQESVEARVKDYVFRADGMLDLPEFVHDVRRITLDTKARKTYDRMKADMLAEVEGTTVTAANAAVLVGKLKQLANGQIYDEDREVIPVHTAKRDELAELVEELGDEQLLIAYEYNHDLDQLRAVLGDDLPVLGAGVSERKAMEHVERWNKGEIQFLAAHPASAGHGINLQYSGAHHILWWGPTFDLDHYIQFNDRLRRQGNVASSVIVHTFVTERSVDEAAMKAREGKASLQDSLLGALTSVFGESILVDTKTEGGNMELLFKSDEAQAAEGQPAQANPFAQAAQPAPTAQQANPFAQAAQAQPQQPAGAQANPFAQAAPSPANPVGQAAAIRGDVAAPPPPSPAEAFAAAGIGEVAPAAPATPPPATPVQDQAEVEDAVVVAPSNGAPPTPAEAVQGAVAASVPEGFMPLYMLIPADKASAVFAAIGRALK